MPLGSSSLVPNRGMLNRPKGWAMGANAYNSPAEAQFGSDPMLMKQMMEMYPHLSQYVSGADFAAAQQGGSARTPENSIFSGTPLGKPPTQGMGMKKLKGVF